MAYIKIVISIFALLQARLSWRTGAKESPDSAGRYTGE